MLTTWSAESKSSVSQFRNKSKSIQLVGWPSFTAKKTYSGHCRGESRIQSQTHFPGVGWESSALIPAGKSTKLGKFDIVQAPTVGDLAQEIPAGWEKDGWSGPPEEDSAIVWICLECVPKGSCAGSLVPTGATLGISGIFKRWSHMQGNWVMEALP
jgi:hypothetical protein